jgi:nuclear cap-binding protein subunit 1
MVPYVGVTFNLPSILVPPEVVELDSLSTESGEDALIKKEEWPEFYARLFDHDVRKISTMNIINQLIISFR